VEVRVRARGDEAVLRTGAICAVGRSIRERFGLALGLLLRPSKTFNSHWCDSVSLVVWIGLNRHRIGPVAIFREDSDEPPCCGEFLSWLMNRELLGLWRLPI
jgi:hypothetical protein